MKMNVCMKTKVWMMATALVCGSFAFTACDDDDDDNYQPESVVTKAFDTKYPSAQRVSWEYESGFAKAEFYDGVYEVEAWFDPQGNWLLTETDLPYMALPQAVKDAFESSAYANWQVEDVDKIEQPDNGTYYILDLENGERDADLHYSEGGVLIKELTDGNTSDKPHVPTVTPNSIRDEVLKMYPDATIFEIDRDGRGYEVEILHEYIHKEVWFDSDIQWLYTEWEIFASQAPDVVMNALQASQYASYWIDDVHVIQRADGLFYEFELEQGGRDITVLFSEEGNLVNG